MRLRLGVVVAVGAMLVVIAGCGGGTKTVTQTTKGVTPPSESRESEQGEESVSLGGSGEKAEYPSVKAVGQAIITDVEERYGDTFESGECENFLPEAGGAPLYTCEIKIGGEWHGNITATIHPDGTFEWRDESESPGGDYEGRELSVSE